MYCVSFHGVTLMVHDLTSFALSGQANRRRDRAATSLLANHIVSPAPVTNRSDPAEVVVQCRLVTGLAVRSSPSG